MLIKIITGKKNICSRDNEDPVKFMVGEVHNQNISNFDRDFDAKIDWYWLKIIDYFHLQFGSFTIIFIEHI